MKIVQNFHYFETVDNESRKELEYMYLEVSNEANKHRK